MFVPCCRHSQYRIRGQILRERLFMASKLAIIFGARWYPCGIRSVRWNTQRAYCRPHASNYCQREDRKKPAWLPYRFSAIVGLGNEQRTIVSRLDNETSSIEASTQQIPLSTILQKATRKGVIDMRKTAAVEDERRWFHTIISRFFINSSFKNLRAVLLPQGTKLPDFSGSIWYNRTTRHFENPQNPPFSEQWSVVAT